MLPDGLAIARGAAARGSARRPRAAAARRPTWTSAAAIGLTATLLGASPLPQHRHGQRPARRAADAVVPGRSVRADPRQSRHPAAQARRGRLRRAGARRGRTAPARASRRGSRLRCRADVRAGAGPGHRRHRDPADDDATPRVRCTAIDDAAAGAALEAERALVDALGGGCQTPIGALAPNCGGRARAAWPSSCRSTERDVRVAGRGRRGARRRRSGARAGARAAGATAPIEILTKSDGRRRH